jgi:pyruvate ferredoxin oxidoreductase beta subunit
MIVREVVNATDYDLVISTATGCLEVCTAIYPYTSWDVSWIHIGFENAAAAIAGAEAMYKARKNKGKSYSDRPVKFIAFGGDGGTYDIGFQSLSGAAERGHDFLYVCLDNENYANTGGQRSSATPLGAHTTTSPRGAVSYGEKRFKKDLTLIMADHGCPYVATAIPGSKHWKDLATKAAKAIETEGPTFINALSPCTTEWKFKPEETVEIADLAVETCAFPLYEIENGKLRITYRPKQKIPVKEYLARQGRFSHLFKKGNEWIIDEWQKHVDEYWDYLQRREECGL